MYCLRKIKYFRLICCIINNFCYIKNERYPHKTGIPYFIYASMREMVCQPDKKNRKNRMAERERTMKRSELEALGLNEEQINSIMASNGKDIQAEKSRAESLKASAEKAEELQRQLDALNEQNMTELEKVTKALELANTKIEQLESAKRIADLKTTVAEKFKVTSEQASQIIKEDGSMDYDILASIISEKESAAANAKELEIAQGSSMVSSNTTAEVKPETLADGFAKTFGKSKADATTVAQSIVDSYK